VTIVKKNNNKQTDIESWLLASKE